MNHPKPKNNLARWCIVLMGIALLVIWSSVCSAEQRIYLDPKLYSFVKYKGDISHPTWGPKRSIVYKCFEFGGEQQVTFKDKHAFSGEKVWGAYTKLRIDGRLSEDWKTLEKLTVNYQQDFEIRKALWSYTLANIPLDEKTDFKNEGRTVFIYKLRGVDDECKPVSLRQNVSGVTEEHLFSDGKSVVLDEFMIDRVICNSGGLEKGHGLYNMVANYQVPFIEVRLEVNVDKYKAPTSKMKKKQPRKGSLVK